MTKHEPASDNGLSQKCFVVNDIRRILLVDGWRMRRGWSSHFPMTTLSDATVHRLGGREDQQGSDSY